MITLETGDEKQGACFFAVNNEVTMVASGINWVKQNDTLLLSYG